jgi:YVTN family beta-propeller protein
MTTRQSVPPVPHRLRSGGAVVAVAAVVLAAVAVPGAAGADDHRWPASGTLWVTNQAGTTGDVSVLDAGTGRVMATIAVGARPIGVVAGRGNGRVYVSNESSNTVSVIDKATFEVVDNIATGPKPHHIALAPDGRMLYVAEFGGNSVAAIDTVTNGVTTLAASASPSARTHAVWAGSNGKLYATNSVVNTVGVVDTRSGVLMEEIPVGTNPSEVLVMRDGRTAYVSARNENQIEVIDLATGAVTAEVVVGPQPDTLHLINDGHTLIVALRGTPAQLALVDTTDLSVRLVTIAGHTTGHHWLSPDGRYTFVAVEGPAGVAVVDNDEGRVVDFYSLPAGARPHGLFYESRPNA